MQCVAARNLPAYAATVVDVIFVYCLKAVRTQLYMYIQYI